MRGRLDFSKIPNDKPAAVHFALLGEAIEFFRELSERYPSKTRNWDESDIIALFPKYADFCLNPYMDSRDMVMCYCDLDYYMDEGYVIVEYSDMLEELLDLPIGVSDASIESLFGIE